MKDLTLATIAGLALAVTSASYGKELYVNQSLGSDSVSYAANSAERPWRSLGRAVWGSSAIASPSASEAARAGDSVIVAPGVYNTSAATNTRYSPIYNPVNRGQAGNPIVIRAEQPGTVTLQATSSTGAQPIIGALNNAHIVWKGFVIDERDVPTRADTGPVVVWNSHHIVLEDLIIRGHNRGWIDNHNGIRLEHVQDIIVRNNYVAGYDEMQNNHNSNALTIYDGTRVLIENNEVDSANAGFHVKCCSPGPITLRFNLIRNTGKAMLFSGVQQATAYSNILVNAMAGITFNLYDDTHGVESVIVSNNTVINATAPGDSAGLLMRYGIEFYRDVRVYNNLISHAQTCVMSYEGSLSTAFRSNYNAFHECLSSFARVSGVGYNWSDWTGQFGRDTEGSQVIHDPKFVDVGTGDFRPTPGSPLIGAGLDILDLNGNGSTTDFINIGAYALGTEVIGRRSLVAPNPPTNLRVD